MNIFHCMLFYSILVSFTLSVNALINDCSGISTYIDFIPENDYSMQEITTIEHVSDSNVIAVGTQSGHVEIWDYLSNSLLTRFEPVNTTSLTQPKVQKILYLHSFDRLLVLNAYQSCPSDINSVLQVWDLQSQSIVSSFPYPQDNSTLHFPFLDCSGTQQIIDIAIINPNSTTSSLMRLGVLTPTSLHSCSISTTMELACIDQKLPSFMNTPLRIVEGVYPNKWIILFEKGLVELNSSRLTHQIIVKNTSSNNSNSTVSSDVYRQCVSFQSSQKYILLQGDKLFIVGQDSYRPLQHTIAELSSVNKALSSIFQNIQNASSPAGKLNILEIIKADNGNSEIFIFLSDRITILTANFESDSVLSNPIKLVSQAKIISKIKNSPSFFVSESNGEIAFYQQSMLLGSATVNGAPFTGVISDNDDDDDGDESNETITTSDTRRRQVLQGYNGNTCIVEINNNRLNVFILDYSESAILENYQRNLPCDDSTMADYLVDLNYNVIYFYDISQGEVIICDINNIENCKRISAPLPNLMNHQLFGNSMSQCLQLSNDNTILAVSDLNTIYVFKFNETTRNSINTTSNISLIDIYHSLELITVTHNITHSSQISPNLNKLFDLNTTHYLLAQADCSEIFFSAISKDNSQVSFIMSYPLDSPAIGVTIWKDFAIIQQANDTILQINFTTKSIDSRFFLNTAQTSESTDTTSTNESIISCDSSSSDTISSVDLHLIPSTNLILTQLQSSQKIIIFNILTKQLTFMNDKPLQNKVCQFFIDSTLTSFYALQYGYSQSLQHYELAINAPSERFRNLRGTIKEISNVRFNKDNSMLVIQTTQNVFYTLEVGKQITPQLSYANSLITNELIAFAEYPYNNLNNTQIITLSAQTLVLSVLQLQQDLTFTNTTSNQLNFKGFNFCSNFTIQLSPDGVMFLARDSTQIFIFSYSGLILLWSKQFSSTDNSNNITHTKFKQFANSQLRLFISFSNGDILILDCSDQTAISQLQTITNNSLINFEFTQSNENAIFTITPQNISLLDLTQSHNDISNISQSVYNHTSGLISNSFWLDSIQILAVYDSKCTLTLLGFGLKENLYLANLLGINECPLKIINVIAPPDRGSLIISDSQRSWILSINSLLNYFDYSQSLSTNEFFQSRSNSTSSISSFNTKCQMNAYFIATLDSRQLSTFGLGTETNPFSHFAALESNVIQFGINNQIFDYNQTTFNLLLMATSSLPHVISKRLSMKGSKQTILNFIGQQDILSSVQLSGGYELNNFAEVNFINLSFFSDYSFSNPLISTSPSTTMPIVHISNVQKVHFQAVSFSSFYQQINHYRTISINSCISLSMSESDLSGITFLVDYLTSFTAQSCEFYGTVADMITNQKLSPAASFSKSIKGLLLLKQKSHLSSKQSTLSQVQTITLNNTLLNSIKVYGLQYGQLSESFPAPSFNISHTDFYASSLLGKDPSQSGSYSSSSLSIKSIHLSSVSSKICAFIADEAVPIKKISSIFISRLRSKPEFEYGFQGSLLLQNPNTPTVIQAIEIKDSYFNNTVLFSISSGLHLSSFQLKNTILELCSVLLFRTLSGNNALNSISFHEVNIIKDSSVIVLQSASSTSSQIMKITSLVFRNSTIDNSAAITAAGTLGQVILNCDSLELFRSNMNNSKIITKGNQVYVNLGTIKLAQQTNINSSTILYSSNNIEQYVVSLTDLPLFNMLKHIDIQQTYFNQSKILDIKDTAFVYINEITFKNSQFQASFLDAIEEDTAQTISPSFSANAVSSTSSSCWSSKSTSTTSSSSTSSVHYLLEVTNLKLFQATISQNIFTGYVISGQPQLQLSDTSEITQIYQNINFSDNSISPRSSFVFFEIDFSSLNPFASISVSNFTFCNNNLSLAGTDSLLPYLEDGKAFFFFGAEKIGDILIENGNIYNNQNIGLSSLKYTLNLIQILNISFAGCEGYPLMNQPVLYVLHTRSLLVQNSTFQNLAITSSSVLQIELNRQFFSSSSEEWYKLRIEGCSFSQITSNLILQSLGTGIISVNSILMTSIIIRQCNFTDNISEPSSTYSHQRSLSFLKITAANSNIELIQNIFNKGSFILQAKSNGKSSTTFYAEQNTMQFHVIGNSVSFLQNNVFGHNYFAGECTKNPDSSLVVFHAAGIFEGKVIFVNNNTFQGLCTYATPPIVFKLYADSSLIIKTCTFKELHSDMFGTVSTGIYVNGVQNNVNVSISDVIVDRIHAAEQTSLTNPPGFIVFENLKSLSQINLKNITVSQLLGNKGAFLSSANLKTTIRIKNINFIGDNNNEITSKVTVDDSSSNWNDSSILLSKQQNGQLIAISNAQEVNVQNLTIQRYNQTYETYQSILKFANITSLYLSDVFFNQTHSQTQGMIIANDSSVNFKNVWMTNCSYGGIAMMQLNNLTFWNSSIANLNVINSNCLNYTDLNGCIAPVTIQRGIVEINNITVSGTRGNNEIGGIYYLASNYNTKSQSTEGTTIAIKLTGLDINGNQGTDIGGVKLEIIGQTVQLNLEDTIIHGNFGQNTGGLAVNFNSSNQLVLSGNTKIFNNTGLKAGGISVMQSLSLQLRDGFKEFIFSNIPNEISSGPRSFEITQQQQQLTMGRISNQQLPFNWVFQDNPPYRTLVSSSSPFPASSQNSSLPIDSSNSSSRQYSFVRQSEKLYEISDFNSGDKIPPFYLSLFDQNNLPYSCLSPLNVKISLSLSSQAQKGSFLKLGSSSQHSNSNSSNPANSIIYSPTNTDSLDRTLFQGIQVYGMPGMSVQLIFTLLDIKYDNSSSLSPFSNSSQSYQFTLDLHMRQCESGEFLKKSLLTTECQACPKLYYSLVSPSLNTDLKCLKCPENTSCPGNNQLLLDAGYWRESESSDIVVKCQFSSTKCLGGSLVSDESCTPEMTGPLCESCNIRKGLTELSGSTCLACNQWWISFILLIVIFISTNIFILMSIDSTISRIKKQSILFQYSSADHLGHNSMLLKQFVSYLQLLAVVTAFRVDVASYSLRPVLINLGNPLMGLFNLINCYTYDLTENTSFPHIYSSLIVLVVLPLCLSLLFFLFQKSLNRQNHYYRRYYICTMIFVVFFYFGPMGFEKLMQFVTCREIGGSRYISASLLYRCDASFFFSLNLLLILPLLLTVGVIIPAVILYFIKKRLNSALPMTIFQYVIGDYRHKMFYWEFVRFFMKIMIVSIPLLIDDTRTMGQVISLVLLIYYIAVLKIHPHWTEVCHKVELVSGVVLFLTYHMSLLTYDKAKFSGWWWITVILFAVTNFPLMIWFFVQFIKAYLPWIKKVVSKKSEIKNKSDDDALDRSARVRLLWQLALFSVREQIMNEKIDQQKRMEAAGVYESFSDETKDYPWNNSDCSCNSNSNNLRRNNQDRLGICSHRASKLLWWRKSNANTLQQVLEGKGEYYQEIDSRSYDKLNDATIEDVSKNKNKNKQDYNPYHDFNFPFLPPDN